MAILDTQEIRIGESVYKWSAEAGKVTLSVDGGHEYELEAADQDAIRLFLARNRPRKSKEGA